MYCKPSYASALVFFRWRCRLKADTHYPYVRCVRTGVNQKAPQGGCGHRRQHARLRKLSEVQKPRDLDLDLGSGQGHIRIHRSDRTCRTTSVTQYRNMAVWISWNIDITWSLNSRDSFPRRIFENRAPISYRPGVILSPATISFELHAKMAEEIDLEMCCYGQLSEVQIVRDLDLDLGWVKVTSSYTVRVGLPACKITWLYRHAVAKYGHLNFVKYRHSAKFELSW